MANGHIAGIPFVLFFFRRFFFSLKRKSGKYPLKLKACRTAPLVLQGAPTS